MSLKFSRIRPLSRRHLLKSSAFGTGAFFSSCRISSGSHDDLKSQSADLLDKTIVRAAIHPAIGVARVGNSEDGYYIGPEIIDGPPMTLENIRDETGALKRQAARFRIYGYNAQNQLVSEILPEHGELTWHVHLANKKAAWYRFSVAMDITEAAQTKVPLRNKDEPDRQKLEIDPGPMTIRGENAGNIAQEISGTFYDESVYLGQLRTDAEGRLLVLGGRGKSDSPQNLPVFDKSNFDTFNNADGWYDDMSDGPVSADLVIDGRNIPVDEAWVIVAPPNYAPDIVGWRTLYDMLEDLFVDEGWLPIPEHTSFKQHILPALKRLSQLGWVNAGFHHFFGHGKTFDFMDPEMLAKLANAPSGGRDPYLELRRSLCEQFRTPRSEKLKTRLEENRRWPMLYGDAYGTFDKSSHLNFTVSHVRALHLSRWLSGDFQDDWQADGKVATELENIPLHKQPQILDEAALSFCIADAFHPGCELTWPLRHLSVYRAPFRIKRRVKEEAVVEESEIEPMADFAFFKQFNGPLYAQAPGDLTRWMAIPWQGDTIFCRSGYDDFSKVAGYNPDLDPFIPSFWPATVPNHVLTESDYEKVMNPQLPLAVRKAAFERRNAWWRFFKGEIADVIMQMVTHFSKSGLIMARPGPKNDPDFPATIYVESHKFESLFGNENQVTEETTPATANPTDVIPSWKLAGWESEERYLEFRKVLGLSDSK